MTYTASQVVKPEVLAAAAVGMLDQELLIPNLFTKSGIDQFKGADNDTVSVKVAGVLPSHSYAWRNDRSTPITFDAYNERKISVTFGGNFYSAVQLSDEQYDFDIEQWSKLLQPQARAVARGLGYAAISELTGASYEVTVGQAEGRLRAALIEARRVLNALLAPADNRYLLVGTDWESELLGTKDLALASNIGDVEAASILAQATIGNRYGFKIVVDQTIPAGDAYAFDGSAFIFLSGAPSVPQSVPFGATTAYEDLALRWVRDYDPTYMVDRSVVNTYAGFQAVTDVIVGWDGTQEVVLSDEYMVRGIKLSLSDASVYPTLNSDLDKYTNVGHAESAAYAAAAPTS